MDRRAGEGEDLWVEGSLAGALTGAGVDLDWRFMSEGTSQPVIRLKGVRHNNLKNFDLDLPLGKLVVVTGLSDSANSSRK